MDSCTLHDMVFLNQLLPPPLSTIYTAGLIDDAMSSLGLAMVVAVVGER